ncbi:hypothetical protein AGLY_007139 [Aphis glycines]|uniref:Uncharacterized protein n=1 Tax=Aphis glycines TaxID=307491 RepID=A0A6G0TR08_APHGL|nr:hypothetical protein AGLY_007139 [Aphis glycines]
MYKKRNSENSPINSVYYEVFQWRNYGGGYGDISLQTYFNLREVWGDIAPLERNNNLILLFVQIYKNNSTSIHLIIHHKIMMPMGNFTCQLNFNKAKVTDINDSSITLKIKIEIAIMRLCPVSKPFIPANIFIAFVQNTASIPIYSKNISERFRYNNCSRVKIYYKIITSLCGNRVVSFCNICRPNMSGINRKIVIRKVHPVTTPKASEFKSNFLFKSFPYKLALINIDFKCGIMFSNTKLQNTRHMTCYPHHWKLDNLKFHDKRKDTLRLNYYNSYVIKSQVISVFNIDRVKSFTQFEYLNGNRLTLVHQAAFKIR